MQENRRSGKDRRQQQKSKPEERKRGKDRRTLLRELERTLQMYKRIPMFDDLTEEQIIALLRICSKKKHIKKQHIFIMGEDSNYMSILLEGKLGIKFISGVKWQTIIPPATVGEMEFFTGQSRSSTVVTETDCNILNINNKEFFNLIRDNKDLGNGIFLNVIRDLSDKLRNANEKIDELYNGLFKPIQTDRPPMSGNVSGGLTSV